MENDIDDDISYITTLSRKLSTHQIKLICSFTHEALSITKLVAIIMAQDRQQYNLVTVNIPHLEGLQDYRGTREWFL